MGQYFPNSSGMVMISSGLTNGVMPIWNDITSMLENSTIIQSNSGITISGHLSATTISTNTAYTNTLYVSDLGSNSEKIITTSGTSGLLQNYLLSDSYYIIDTTLISDLLNETKWTGKTYAGTTIGAVEGQEYIGVNYRYLYQNSIFTRYKIDSDNILIVTNSGSTTLVVNTEIVYCNCSSAVTLILPDANLCVFSQLYIKNINNGLVTISSSTLIDSTDSKILNYNDSVTLNTNKTNYYILSNNVTVSGTTGYLAKFNNSTSVSNSLIFDNSSGITISGYVSASTIYISNLGSTTEKIITVSASTGELNNYLTTDQEFITNSTVISNILSGANWSYNTYIGSTIGLVEGQKYQCCNFLYVYSNSTFQRYKNSNTLISLYTITTTATTDVDYIICSASTSISIYLPAPRSLLFGEVNIKNAGSGDVIVYAASGLIEGQTSITISPWNSFNLFVYSNNYYIK